MQSTLTVQDLCKKLKPVFGKKIDKLYLSYALSDSLEKRMEIERALNALYHKHLNESLLSETILLEPPKNDLIKGEYPLATVMYADKEISTFGLRERDFPRHICVSGMSGSGKTTFAYQILGNFILKKKPFMVFDWKKSFRPLLDVDKKILCFALGNERTGNFFKININKPPTGVSGREWINLICDLVSECFFASHGTYKILQETMDKLFRKFGVYEGSGNYPTWHDIKKVLEEKEEELSSKSHRESEWLTSALRIAHSLTFGSFGDALNYKGEYGMTVEELLEKNVIFELNSLNTAEKKFFCEFILSYIYKHKKANDTIREEFVHAILVDEAHNIFLKDKPNFIKENISDVIYREIREYGTSLICLDQHISKLSDVVAGNSACNIAFQQMLHADVETVSSLMQLRDRRQFFSMLPVGQAIVRLAERYPLPFLIKVPNVKPKSNTKDEEVRERMKGLVKTEARMKMFNESCKVGSLVGKIEREDMVAKAAGVDTGLEFSEIKAAKKDNRLINRNKKIVNHIQKELTNYAEEQLKNDYSKDQIKAKLLEEGYKREDVLVALKNAKFEDSYLLDTHNNLNPEHRKFLQILQNNSSFGTTAIYNHLKLSGRKGNSIKNELLRLGLISVDEIRSDSGWTKQLVLTEHGKSLLENPETAERIAVLEA